ncbi:hypothetical protein KIN20_012622 [Parelaphostrongylus tenuis]|uniref:Uncharacterized protein n=1 Tax=Parelaphostrongylus tenuis TaxID=148309 RepID=A0AAD5QNA1_PARTN|nr:hypothetical protein KIN20_012622 [Parelaphostrongylus tenuis]
MDPIQTAYAPKFVAKGTILSMVSLFAPISTVFGCGVMPAGQGSSRPFTGTGFTTLPSSNGLLFRCQFQSSFSGIAPNEDGRSALLPDAVIAAIMGQLSVTISYTPTSCQMPVKPKEKGESCILDNHLIFCRQKAQSFLNAVLKMKQSGCIIAGNTVTGICNVANNNAQESTATDPGNMVEITAIPASHLTISGTLSTTNIIMANWSRMMWQNVVDRAVRVLASGPFGLHFFSARATVGGN